MALIDLNARELTLNVVYFGPRGSGCGTNVRQLHRIQPAREKAELRRIAGRERTERIWHFAYHPPERPAVGTLQVKIRVSSVPAGSDLTLAREEVLTGLDGVVFVADARKDRQDANRAAIHDLEAVLAAQGMDLGAIPLVLQVNQTDAPDARPAARVSEDLNPFGLPVFEATTRQGKGVIETHDAMVSAVLTRLRDNMAGNVCSVPVTALWPLQRAKHDLAILEHAAELPQAEQRMPATLSLQPVAEIGVAAPGLDVAAVTQLVRAELLHGRLRTEIVVRTDEGSHRKVALVLAPGVSPAVPAVQPPSGGARAHLDRSGNTSTSPLPPREDHVHIHLAVLMAALAVLVGMLAGYLLFA